MKVNIFKFRYARIIYGILFLLLGGVFSLLPMIPLGYISLFAALLLLAKHIPILDRLLIYLKRKDKSGKLKSIEKKINRFFGNEE